MTVRVHALTESSDLKPWGDCYAPQVVFTNSYGGYWHIHELNTEMLPMLAEEFRNAWVALGDEGVIRWARIFHGIEVHHKSTTGHSQGDWGESFVFATPEWMEMTGAKGVNESDHNNFCAWLWGDVYEVFDDETTALTSLNVPTLSDLEAGNDAPLIIYGMDEAMKYGEITFPTTRIVMAYEYND